MIKDDIISIAREAGCLGPGLGGDPDGLWEPSGEENVTELMFRFAELLEAKVRADEREKSLQLWTLLDKAAYAAGVAAEKARCAALCSEVAAGRDAEAIEEAILVRGEK